MEVNASHRYAKIAPRKARLVIDAVRGLRVDAALEVLRFLRKRAAPMVAKVVRSAVAAAGEQHSVDPDELRVKRAWVDEGPRGKWHWARPRGSWARLLHRTSHIHVVLSDEDEEAAAPEAAKEGRG